MITKQEERKVTTIAAASSLLIMAGIIALFIFWMIHVPNPPSIVTDVEFAGGGGGQSGGVEVQFGASDPSWENYQFPEPVNETPVSNAASADNSVLITSDDGVNINEQISEVKNNTETPKNNTSNNTNTNTNTNTNPKKWGDALSNANTNSNGGNNNNGTSDDPGGGGGPDFTTGGGTGGTTGGGPGKGPNKGPGFGTGRTAIVMPCRPNVTKNEGKVVVIIKVDRNGTVIDADPNGPGTDTSDPELKLQARQAALCTKFEACTDCPAVSKGTIIFDFGINNK